jgi:moderate conductance mechanosensitive channel
MSLPFAQTPAPAPVPPVDQVCAGREAIDGINVVCSAVYELIGQGAWQATIARIAGGTFEILLILVVAFIALRLSRRVIKRFVRKFQQSGVERLGALRGRGPLADTSPMDLARVSQRTETIAGVLRSVATFAISVVAFALVIGVFGIDLGPLIAGAGIVGVALGFGSQNLVRDFLSGVFMLLEDQYGVGDIVDVGEASGVVEGISLRTTRLRDVYGTVWYVPNGEIRRVGNKSQLWARSLLDIRVALNTDVKKASEVIKRVADEVWRDEKWSSKVLEEPEVWGIEDFGASEIVIRLVLKVEPGSQWAINREVRARLLKAFDRAGIDIPDQRELLLRQPEPDDMATSVGPLGREWGPAERP